jgi:hypothetical protein
MSQFEVLKEHHYDFATPGKKPLELIKIDRSNKITRGIISVIGDGLSPLVIGTDGVFKTLGKSKGIGCTTALTDSAWTAPSAANLAPLPQSTLYVIYEQTTYNISINGSTIYAERPNGTQIYKINQETGNVINWVIRNAAGSGLQLGPVSVAIDTTRSLHTTCFVRAGDADRTLYSDGNKGTHTGSSAGTYNPAIPNLCADPESTVDANEDISILAVVGFNRPITEAEYRSLDKDPFQLWEPTTAQIYNFPSVAAVTSVTTGTSVPTQTEVEYVAGGETSILTLTGDTWVAAGSAFNAVRQAIINGFDSAQLELLGWNKEIRDKEVVTAVVRTSDTVVTITWTAAAAYDITATETITPTIPASALVLSSSSVVSTPTFTVTPVVAPGGIIVLRRRLNGYR